MTVQESFCEIRDALRDAGQRPTLLGARARARVFVCSPFRGDELSNALEARAICSAVVLAGCAPFAPHLLYPQFLAETDAGRAAGLDCGAAWLAASDVLLVVGEPTPGMAQEIAWAGQLGIPVRRVRFPPVPIALVEQVPAETAGAGNGPAC